MVHACIRLVHKCQLRAPERSIKSLMSEVFALLISDGCQNNITVIGVACCVTTAYESPEGMGSYHWLEQGASLIGLEQVLILARC